MSSRVIPETPYQLAPITEVTFETVEKRIYEETYNGGEILSLEDPYLPKMMLQCFEEFNAMNENLFTREQIKAIWEVFTPDQKQAIVKGLNDNQVWY